LTRLAADADLGTLPASARWGVAVLAAFGCASPEKLTVENNVYISSPDSGSGAAGAAPTAPTSSPPGVGGMAPIGGSGGSATIGGSAGSVASGGNGGNGSGGTFPVDGGAPPAPDGTCPDPGTKRCGGLCVAPAPGVGCSLTDCTPCPESSVYASICSNAACSFDCPPGEVPTTTGCIVPGAHCSSGVTDEDETDVDCGGTSCAPCSDGDACLATTDCVSTRCEGSVCSSCTDGVQSGAETGVDCGGAGCGLCPGPKVKTLTISGSDATGARGSHTDFPVLVRITDPDLAGLDASGNDLRFTSDAVGTAPLPFERESYDATTGSLVAWVKMNVLDAGQDFYLVYDEGDLTDKSSPSQVWTSGFHHVWHMEDTSPIDHGAGASNPSANGNVSAVAAIVGSGLDFTGDWLDFSNSLTGNPSHTISMWLYRRDKGANVVNNVLSKGTFGDDTMLWIRAENGNGDGVFGWKGNVDTPSPPALDTWVHVVWTYDGPTNTGNVYYDGALHSGPHTYTTTPNVTGTNGSIGSRADNDTDPFQGRLDELRWATGVVRSADWVATEYNNQRTGSSFLTVGPEQAL
jgi:hypothetical protein